MSKDINRGTESAAHVTLIRNDDEVVLLNTQHDPPVNKVENKKMVFIYNAVNDGWKVKKSKNMYIFSRKHRGRKEYFRRTYLDTFVTSYANHCVYI